MSDLIADYTSTTKEQLLNYDYLIVVDFEATCDNGNSPSISLSRNNQEMIEFPFILLQLLPSEQELSKVIHAEQNYVLPEYSTQLTPFCENLTGISWNTLQQYGKPIRKVVQHFDNFIANNLKDKRFCIITDGEWDMKQLMIRESKNKNFLLASHYYTFFDLRKEYRKCFPDAYVRGLSSMVEHSRVGFTGRHHSGIDDCHTICNIINHLLLNGHQFQNPISIDPYYDPFRDSSFSNFRQTSPTQYSNNYYNTSYSFDSKTNNHNNSTHLIPMYAYPREMFYPYQSYQNYYNLYNKYVGNNYPSVPYQSKKKRRNKRKAYQSPGPKTLVAAPKIGGNDSDLSL